MARRGVRRAAFRVIAFAIAAVVLYLGVTAAQVYAAGRRDEREPADAIVVLGAAQYHGQPSPIFASRLDHALTLWRDGVAPRIAVTGGRRAGDPFTEASAAASYLIQRGVPDDPEVLLLESEARNTWESLAAVALILENRGLERVVLVSSPTHALRSGEIAQGLGLDVQLSSTLTAPISTRTALRQGVRETAAVAAGRIVGHRRLSAVDRLFAGGAAS